MRTSDRTLQRLERLMRSPTWAFVPWRFIPPYRSSWATRPEKRP